MEKRAPAKSFQDLIVWMANIAEGSLEECRYHLILAHDLGYMNNETHWPLSEEVARLLNAYRTAILHSNS